MVCRLTQSELKRTTWTTLLTLLPPEVIQDHVRGDFYLKLRNGSEIQGMHLQDEVKLRSENLDWVYIDEASEVKEVIWKEMMGRLRGNTQLGRLAGPLKMWVTSNPEGRNWIYKSFVEVKRPDHAYFHAPTSENPHLPEGYVQSLLQNYDEDWVRKFLEGSWDVFEGQVFPMFDRDIHVLEWESHQIPKEWPRYRGIDHGWADPFCCTWMAIDFEGNCYFYNMIYRKQQTIENNCKMIHEVSGNESYEWTVWDPSINRADPVTGRRLSDIYREHGIHGLDANNSIDMGIARMREMFQVRYERIHPATKELGAPKIYILHHLKEAIWEMQQYRYPNSDDSRNAPTKPIDVHNHWIDAARYTLMGAVQAAEAKTESSMHDYIEHLLNKRNDGSSMAERPF